MVLSRDLPGPVMVPTCGPGLFLAQPSMTETHPIDAIPRALRALIRSEEWWIDEARAELVSALASMQGEILRLREEVRRLRGQT